jgi:hypothetical protein
LADLNSQFLAVLVFHIELYLGTIPLLYFFLNEHSIIRHVQNEQEFVVLLVNPATEVENEHGRSLIHLNRCLHQSL